MTLAQHITAAGSHTDLKVAGRKLYNQKNLKDETRTALIRAYRTKRNEMDRPLCDTAPASFKNLLFRINTMNNDPRAIARIGREVYAVLKDKAYDKFLNDLLYRAYIRQSSKRGYVIFKNRAANTQPEAENAHVDGMAA